MTEQSIMQTAINSKFEELFRATVERVSATIRFCLGKLGTDENVSDMVQATYLKAYEKLDSLRDQDAFSAWVNQIARNNAMDFLKSKGRLEVSVDEFETDYQIEDVDDEARPDLALDQKESAWILQEVVDTLPDNQRLAVVMHYFQNLPLAAVATVFGCSEGTVKSRLFHARDKIKTRLMALEAEGVQLRGFAPMPFLLQCFNSAEKSFSLSEPITEQVLSGMMKGIGESTAAAGSAATSGSMSGMSSGLAPTAGFFATVSGKIIALIAVGCVAVFGVVMAINNSNADFDSGVLVDSVAETQTTEAMQIETESPESPKTTDTPKFEDGVWPHFPPYTDQVPEPSFTIGKVFFNAENYELTVNFTGLLYDEVTAYADKLAPLGFFGTGGMFFDQATNQFTSEFMKPVEDVIAWWLWLDCKTDGTGYIKIRDESKWSASETTISNSDGGTHGSGRSPNGGGGCVLSDPSGHKNGWYVILLSHDETKRYGGPFEDITLYEVYMGSGVVSEAEWFGFFAAGDWDNLLGHTFNGFNPTDDDLRDSDAAANAILNYQLDNGVDINTIPVSKGYIYIY